MTSRMVASCSSTPTPQIPQSSPAPVSISASRYIATCERWKFPNPKWTIPTEAASRSYVGVDADRVARVADERAVIGAGPFARGGHGLSPPSNQQRRTAPTPDRPGEGKGSVPSGIASNGRRPDHFGSGRRPFTGSGCRFGPAAGSATGELGGLARRPDVVGGVDAGPRAE